MGGTMRSDPLAPVLALAPHAERLDEQAVRLVTKRVTLNIQAIGDMVRVESTYGAEALNSIKDVKPEDLLELIGRRLIASGTVNAPINRPHERDGVYTEQRGEWWTVKFAVAHWRKELAAAEANAATAAPEDGYHIRVAYEMRRRISLAGEKP